MHSNIKEYEEICPKCKGEGFFNVTIKNPKTKEVKLPCMYCRLTGKINWIDKIKRSRFKP